MIALCLLALVQAGATQDKPVEERVAAFIKGDDAARKELAKLGAGAIRPLLKERDKAPEKIEALLAELRKGAAVPKADTVAFLQLQFRISVHFDRFEPKDLKSEEVTVELRDTSGRETLDRICRQTGLDYGFFHNVLVIGKPERLWPAGKVLGAFGSPAAERQRKTDADEKTLDHLRQLKTGLDYQNSYVADIVAYLKEFSGLDLAIEGDAGHASLTIKIKEARGVDALSLVTQSHGLDFMLKDGKVIIGTRAEIEKALPQGK